MKKTLLFIVGAILVCQIGFAQSDPSGVAVLFLSQGSSFYSNYQIDTLCWDYWVKTESPGGLPYQFLHHNKLMFSYNPENKISRIDAYQADSSPSKANTSWVYSNIFIYEYDENGRIISYKEKIKYGNNWIDDRIYSYIYNEQNLVDTLKILDTWYGATIDSLRFIYSYDETGNCINSLIQRCNSYYEWLWTNVQVLQYTYDNENLATFKQQTWDNVSWKNSDSISYLYENGQIINQTHLKWDNAGGCWYNYENYMYEYVPSEYTTNIVQQTWNNEWVDKNRTVKQFNESGSPIRYEYQNWQDETWVKKSVCEYSTDEGGNCSDAFCMDYSANGGLVDSRDNYSMEMSFNNGISQLSITGQRLHASYFSTNGTNESIVFEKANVFPNPGTSQLTIQTDSPFTNVIMYDLMGHQVFNQTISESTIQIHTESWPSGIYFWKAYNSSSAQCGKWIKE